MNLLAKGIFRGLIFIGIALIVLAILYAGALQTPNFCRMTYMNPFYAEMPVDSKYSYKYNLLLYQEGAQRMSDFMKNPWPRGIPVLFIPGNAGHYKQGRSLASASSILCDAVKSELKIKNGPEFDFFTVDSREELSALNGEILMEQTQFVNDCIRAILSVYNHLPTKATKSLPARPTSVLLVGHSMGGLIATAVYTQSNYIPNSVTTILTLNTPYNGHPFFYRKSLSDFYHQVHEYWRRNINSELRDVAIISISGSFRDQLIDSSLTTLHALIPTTNAFSVLTTGIPSVWVETDHQCIVWCNQLIQKLSHVLLDLVDSSSLQYTLPLKDRMKVFQKHLLSKIPSSLGLLLPSDNQYLPSDYVESSIHYYHSRPKLSPNSTFLVDSINPGNAIFASELQDQEYKLPLMFLGIPSSVDIFKEAVHFTIPSKILENNVHFAYLTDLSVDVLDVFLCDNHSGCTYSLSEKTISLPSHSSFLPYTGEYRYHTPQQPYDNSPQSLVHFSPFQLQSFNYVSIRFNHNSSPKLSMAQFYKEKTSSLQIKEKTFNYSFGFKEGHAVLVNISVPFKDNIATFLASLHSQCEEAEFPPVVIQYRPALQEQHIHTNASVIPLRFHISTEDDHHLILLIDPKCPYKFDITMNIPLALAGLFYTHRTAAVSGIAAWWSLIFAIQQFTYLRSGKFPPFNSASRLGLAICCISLIISFFIPHEYYVAFFQYFPEILSQHSFSFFEVPSPMALRIILFSSCCTTIVLGSFVQVILLRAFAMIIHLLHKIARSPLKFRSNPRKGALLTIIAILLGYKTHIVVPLVFIILQLAISYSRVLYTSPNSSIRESQCATIYLLSYALVEAIPSSIQFVKAFFYEVRFDDGFLYLHYALIILGYLAAHYQAHARHIHWIFPLIVSVTILAYALTPFYKVAWFVTTMAISCILSYFPLLKIETPAPPKIKKKTD